MATFSSGLTTADLSIVKTQRPTGGGALSYNSNSLFFFYIFPIPADATAQTLTLNSDNLQISGGNTISLASLLPYMQT